MKKILCVLISIVILSTSVTVFADTAVTMYAPDGRTASVPTGDVAAWKSVGWFDSPVTVMYAPDGRTAYVGTNDVAAWKSVGWFDSPVTVMYAPDGRTAYVGKNDVAAWKSVGWFDSPVTVMYAPDGRTAYVGANDVAAWKAVGWYTEKVGYIPSSYVISKFCRTWGDQGLTMDITYKYGNLFNIYIKIPYGSDYTYYAWDIVAEINENNVLTYKNGVSWYVNYGTKRKISSDESGTVKFIPGSDMYIDDWDTMQWFNSKGTYCMSYSGWNFY